MKKPLVVIVGRPNVGKSTLFNRMCRSRAAVVEDIPGVTRDRHYRDAVWEDKSYTVVDTGGFYIDPPEDIYAQAKEQALFAIDEGDIVIHLMDGKDGLTPADIELARLLRTSGKKVIWAVNKVDAPTRQDRLYDFFEIGSEDLLPISAVTGYGYPEFMERLSSFLPDYAEEPSAFPRIAVVGRPNVGKSTLVNGLLGKQRMVVSSTPGTTLDAIDSVCTYYGSKYLLIDTAGLRKKGKIGYSLERFAMVRAHRSIERCDVALIVLDAGEGVTEQDVKIAGLVKEYGRGAVIVLNKWDLVPKPEEAFPSLMAEVERRFWFAQYAPVLTIAGAVKKRITKVFPIIDRVIAERKRRVPTNELNRYFRNVMEGTPLPLYRGKSVKLYYITQVKTEPPSFVVFANYPEGVQDAHLRFFERGLREHFGFEGTPIRITVRQRTRSQARR